MLLCRYGCVRELLSVEYLGVLQINAKCASVLATLHANLLESVGVVCAAGDLLFTLVQGLQPAKDSAKITGMLLEMTEPEILHILEDRAALIKKARHPSHSGICSVHAIPHFCMHKACSSLLTFTASQSLEK